MLEQLGAQVLKAARSGRGIVDLTALSLCQRDEPFRGFRGQCRIHREPAWTRTEHGYWRESLFLTVGQLVDVRVVRVRRRHDEQRVTIRRGFRNGLRSEQTARARTIVDDHLLSETIAQLLSRHAADDV